MLRTEETEYIVSGVERTHIWLEVLHGPDQGIRVSVPLNDDLQDLSESDVVTAILGSNTENSPNWHVVSIKHNKG